MIKTTVYLNDEIKKLIAAFQNKYSIPQCDGLPYEPKGIDIYLTGSTAEPVEEKSEEPKPPYKPFKETFHSDT